MVRALLRQDDGANAKDTSALGVKPGLVMHAAALYDLTVWIMTFGRERAFRERILEWARLQSGETVLDVGCGTGALAIAAKQRVGSAGEVHGVDASPEMLARADKKSRKAGSEVTLMQAAAQELPFPDAQFDVVLTTLMLHHLPRKAREQCAREIARVLKPSGRVLAVDFSAPAREQRGFLSHFHRRGHIDPGDIAVILGGAGLNVVESGAVGFQDLQFAVATPSRGT